MGLRVPNSVQRPKAEGYNLFIHDTWFRTVTSQEVPIRFGTRDALAERSDDTGNVYENVPDIGFTFARSNLLGGEGLPWYPRQTQVGEADPLDSVRYWDSRNLRIDRPDAGFPNQISLQRAIRLFLDAVDPVEDLVTTKDHIIATFGEWVRWYDGWDNTTPVQEVDMLSFGGVAKLASTQEGDLYYLTDNGGLWYTPYDDITLQAELYDSPTDGFKLTNIWTAKGRIFAERTDTSTQHSTVELLEGTPVPTELVSPKFTLTWRVVDTAKTRFLHVIDAGIAVVAACNDGTLRSYVPQADSAGAAPVLTIRAITPMPTSQTPYVLGYSNGVLLIGTLMNDPSPATTTTARLFSAQVLDARFDFAVGPRQLLRTWENTFEKVKPTKRMVDFRNRLGWSMHEADGIETFWAYDTISTGLIRFADLGANVSSLVIFDGLLGFAQGSEIRVEDENLYQDEGYLISPNVNFGLATEINWLASTVEAENVESQGAEVELWRTSDPAAIRDPSDSSWTLVQRVSHPSQSGFEIPMAQVTSLSQALMLKLRPSTSKLDSPRLNRFAIRGIQAYRDHILEVPVDIGDVVASRHRYAYRVPNYGDLFYQKLLDLSGRSVDAQVIDPPFWFRGIVDTQMTVIPTVTDRGSAGKYCLVRLRGVRIIAAGTGAATNRGLGIGTMGIASLGVDT